MDTVQRRRALRNSAMKRIIRDLLSAILLAQLPFGPCKVTAPWRQTATLLLVCLIMVAPNAGASAQEQDAVGEVVRQVGVVTALRATTARPLRLGAPVFQGDRVITAEDAKVEIEFRDGSTLSVGSGTEVEVVDYSPDGRQYGRLELLIGIIRSSLSELWGGGFEVQTRAAVASVRSTEWVTEAQEDRSSVFVISGEVEVTGTADGTRVLLGEGQGTDVEVGGTPSQPTQWGSSRVEDVLTRTRLP